MTPNDLQMCPMTFHVYDLQMCPITIHVIYPITNHVCDFQQPSNMSNNNDPWVTFIIHWPTGTHSFDPNHPTPIVCIEWWVNYMLFVCIPQITFIFQPALSVHRTSEFHIFSYFFLDIQMTFMINQLLWKCFMYLKLPNAHVYMFSSSG